MVCMAIQSTCIARLECRAAAALAEDHERGRGGSDRVWPCGIVMGPGIARPRCRSREANVARPQLGTPQCDCEAGTSSSPGRRTVRVCGERPVIHLVAKGLFLDRVSVAVVGDLCSQLVRRWTRMRQTCVLIPASSYCAVCFR